MLVVAVPVLVVVLFGAWLLKPPPYETLRVHRTGDTVTLVDSGGHEIHGDRYTTTFHDGDTARCRVRRFWFLQDPVIEGCKPGKTP